MNPPQDFLHTWTMNRNSKLIRMYVWLYFGDDDASALSSLTFCKVFWGTLLSPLTLLVRTVLFASGSLGGWVYDRFEKTPEQMAQKDARKKALTAAERAKRREKAAAKAARGPRTARRMVESVGNFFDRIAAFCQNHDKFFFWLRSIILGVIVAALAALIVFEFWQLVTIIKHHAAAVFEWAGFGLLGLLAVIGVGLAVEWLLKKSRVWRHFCSAVHKGFTFVGHFFADGYHAVKYRTCPRITVVD